MPGSDQKVLVMELTDDGLSDFLTVKGFAFQLVFRTPG